MTWEEEMLMEGLRHLLRPRAHAQRDLEEQRRRSDRIRYFLSAFGAAHWAERVDGRRVPFARSGNIAL